MAWHTAEHIRRFVEGHRLQFASQVDEMAFRSTAIAGTRPYIRFAAALAATIVIVFAAFDLLDGSPLQLVLTVRGYWLAIVVVFAGLNFSKQYIEWSQLTGFSAITLFCGGWLFYPNSPWNLGQVLIFNFFLAGLLFRTAMISGAVPLGFHLWGAANDPQFSPIGHVNIREGAARGGEGGRRRPRSRRRGRCCPQAASRCALGQPLAAIVKGPANAIQTGRPPALGGPANTRQVTDAVLEALRADNH